MYVKRKPKFLRIVLLSLFICSSYRERIPVNMTQKPEIIAPLTSRLKTLLKKVNIKITKATVEAMKLDQRTEFNND